MRRYPGGPRSILSERWMRWIGIAVTSLGLAIAVYEGWIGWSFRGHPAGPAGQMPPMPVFAAQVTQEPLVTIAEAVGSLKAIETVTISPEIPGRLTAIAAEQGQMVRSGALLATLDSAIYEAEVGQAQARRQLWQANAVRATNLVSKGAGTQKAKDEAISELGVAEATLRLAQANLSKTRITAPFDGILGLRQVSPGEYLAPGQPIISLSRIDQLYVDFTLPETDLAHVAVGQKISFASEAFPGKDYAATIYAIDPQLDPTGRSISIRAISDNPDSQLKPGLFVAVKVATGQIEQALLVPEEALIPRGDRNFVFKIKSDNTVDFVPVQTGARSNGKVQLISGVALGETVVTDGQLKLRPGAAVSVTKP